MTAEELVNDAEEDCSGKPAHRDIPSSSSYLFRTCKTHFIFGEKCAHFNALYYANALYSFLGFSFPVTLALIGNLVTKSSVLKLNDK